MTTGSAAVQILPAALTVSLYLPSATAVNANWPVMEVAAEYSRLLSIAKSLTMAMSTGFPAESRRTPFQESAGEAWRIGTRTNARTRKEARTSRPAQESIERHYTRVDSDHDYRSGSAAKSWSD